MGLFRYEAVDKTGRVLRGAMDAHDEAQVRDKLVGMGYSPRAIYHPGGNQATVQTTAAATSTAVAAPASSGVPISVKSCVPMRTLAAFFRQIATLVRSGISLQQSFIDLAMVTRNKHLRMACAQMQVDIQNGQKLSGAMAKFPHIFPVHATASVWAGELCGNVDIALEEVAADLEREAGETLFGMIGWGITKATVIFALFAFPFFDINRIFKAAMAGSTDQAGRNILAMVIAVLKIAIPASIVLILLFLAWGRAKQLPAVRRVLDVLVLHAPVWGKLHRCRSNARFLHVLDMLYAAGISPGTAWDAASLSARNSEVAAKLQRAKVNSPNVERVSDLFQTAGVFDPEDIGTAMAGEKGGRLPEVLGNLSSIYEDRVKALRTWGRLCSVHALIISQLLITLAAVALMASSYRSFLEPLLNDAMGGP